MSDWPNNADGDVFRRLAASGFDFSQKHLIDFNIDLVNWPPPDEAILRLREAFPDAAITLQNGDRFLLFQTRAALNYEYVIRMQDELTKIAESFGGRCDSWGVLQ